MALSIEANAKTAKDEPLFMLELVYAGTVTLAMPQDAFGPLLFIETPRLLFLFARAVVANATREAWASRRSTSRRSISWAPLPPAARGQWRQDAGRHSGGRSDA